MCHNINYTMTKALRIPPTDFYFKPQIDVTNEILTNENSEFGRKYTLFSDANRQVVMKVTGVDERHCLGVFMQTAPKCTQNLIARYLLSRLCPSVEPHATGTAYIYETTNHDSGASIVDLSDLSLAWLKTFWFDGDDDYEYESVYDEEVTEDDV